VLTAGAEAGDHRGAKPLRELIERVTVARDAARPDGLDIVITGRLNAILGDGAFPNLCTKAVAGARYIRQKQAIDAIFAFCA
jgi:site-specific DNA recombinase